jgi:lipoprotein-anchoring transpeptidase ErfK/SrfK
MIKRIASRSFFGVLLILLMVDLLAYGVNLAAPTAPSPQRTSSANELVRKNQSLRKRIARFYPQGVYIVVDTAQNLLFLKEGTKTRLKAVVSSGSGNILKDPSGRRAWIFDSPRGEFEVKRKMTGPVWIKPDWAFIEEGKKIPQDRKERMEEGVLGDYALAFGNSFFIHGTLYTRLLGKNVTHGCIRVGDKDLKTVYRSSREGTKIFIF